MLCDGRMYMPLSYSAFYIEAKYKRWKEIVERHFRVAFKKEPHKLWTDDGIGLPPLET